MADVKPTILLVEDDAALIDMYTVRIKEEGLPLLVASDGLTGLALAKEHKPAAILLDVMLPKMDGFAVLQELKKEPSTASIPVLLLTNLAQHGDMEKGKQLGAEDYVIKSSLTPGQVVEKIKSLLKGRVNQ